MAIKKSTDKEKEKENKFDNAVADLDEQEAIAQERSKQVVKAITGTGAKTRQIVDKNGRVRNVKVAEKRKSMPVYIPESLYVKFDEINTAYHKSNNSVIVELIMDYVEHHY